MASCLHLFFLVICLLFSERASCFIDVTCDPTSKGQVNYQSVLRCEVKPTQDIQNFKITLVVWRKTGIKMPVLVFDQRDDKQEYKNSPGYELSDHALKNGNVSLLITKTQVEHEGQYTCEVTTNSGYKDKTTILKVTAKYNTPTVISTDPENSPRVQKILICEAHGGYPQGQLRWFDESKTEWTKSAVLTVNKTKNGVDLRSVLDLLKGSTFSEYTCVVYNASGGKEESATISFPPVQDAATMTEVSPRIIAPIVVIGSLIVGLLMTLLFCRRRSQKNRRPSTAPLIGTHHEVSRSDPEPGEPLEDFADCEKSMA